jgi:hypothetical protein
MGDNGAVQIVPTYFNAIGSIGPAGAGFLSRLAEQQFQGKSLSIVSTFLLRGAAKFVGGLSFQPDLVLWKSNYYIVQEVTDYSQFGTGMVQANCVTFDYVDAPPVENTASVPL